VAAHPNAGLDQGQFVGHIPSGQQAKGNEMRRRMIPPRTTPDACGVRFGATLLVAATLFLASCTLNVNITVPDRVHYTPPRPEPPRPNPTTPEIAPPSDCPNRVTGIAHVGVMPVCPVLSTDGAYAYVTHWSGDFRVVRLSDMTVVDSAHIEGKPGVAALVGDGLYVPLHLRDSVAVLSLGDFKVTRSIPVGHNPVKVVPSPDHQYLYVTNFGGSDVSVISVAENALAWTIQVGRSPWDIDFSADGCSAYVTLRGDNAVAVVNTAERRVTSVIPGFSNPHDIQVLPDNAHACVANLESNTVSVVDLKDHKIVATVRVGKRPTGLAALPDGRYVYVGNWQDEVVSVIRTRDWKLVGSLRVGLGPDYMAVAADGRTVFVALAHANQLAAIGY
jgi:YVTN family beta-propeller protein